MRNEFLISTSAIVAFGVGALIWTAEPSTWIPTVNELINPEDPVLVVIVGSPQLVDSVRVAISPDRIIADTGDAFALVDRRIIAASAEAASGPINQLGWIDDPLDLVAMSSDRGRQWEQGRGRRGAGGAKGKLSEEDQAQAEKIAVLMQKSTITSSEANMLLQHMDATGQF
jgi:hypothetical protein